MKAKDPTKVPHDQNVLNPIHDPGPSQPKITKFTEEETEPLERVLARMAAEDGVRFCQFITSRDYRLGLQARGYDVPKSATTIADRVIKFGINLRARMVEKICKLTKTSCPAIVIAEWTSNANRRYLNVVVITFRTEQFNLGMFRLVGTQPAEALCQTLHDILNDHGVAMETVAGITTDGAAVM